MAVESLAKEGHAGHPKGAGLDIQGGRGRGSTQAGAGKTIECGCLDAGRLQESPKEGARARASAICSHVRSPPHGSCERAGELLAVASNTSTGGTLVVAGLSPSAVPTIAGNEREDF